MASEHLVKILAERGVASRRGAERLIRDGEVTVDGAVQTDPGVMLDPDSVRIAVDGHRLPAKPEPAFFVMHKPKGVITSRKDPQERKTVFDLLPTDFDTSIQAVGRLDFGTEGVLLLTNDGELAYRLTHPSYGVTKSYLVKVSGSPEERKIKAMEKGVNLEDGRTAPALVELVRSTGPSSWLLITISEGRNRIVRRMIDHIGHRTLKLKRVGFGGITLRALEPSKVRVFTKGELEHLRRLVAKPGTAKLKVTHEVRKAVAEALRLPLPPRKSRPPKSLDEEGRPYRRKGWARPKAKKTKTPRKGHPGRGPRSK
jgi:23S rRNA pseudouridine2605 synthase